MAWIDHINFLVVRWALYQIRQSDISVQAEERRNHGIATAVEFPGMASSQRLYDDMAACRLIHLPVQLPIHGLPVPSIV